MNHKFQKTMSSQDSHPPRRIRGVRIIFLIIIFTGFFGFAKISWAADYFSWDNRIDRDGKPAGYFDTTPFPIDETISSYSITNDEGTKTFNLGTVYFVDGTLSGTCSGLYNPATRACSGGSYTAYKTIAAGVSGVSAGNKTILVRDGTYTANSIYMRAGPGDTHRYSLIGYNQERPIVDGTGGGYDPIITGATYSTIQRLEIKNATDAGVRSGGTYNNFIDLYVHDINAAFGNSGLHFENTDYIWAYHCTVSRTKNHAYKVADGTDYTVVEWSVARYVGYWEPEGDVHYLHSLGFDICDHESTGYSGINNILRYSIFSDGYAAGINIEHNKGFSVHHNEVYNAFRVYDVNAQAAAWVGDKTNGAYSVLIIESTDGVFYSNVIRDKRGVAEGTNDHGHLQIEESTSVLSLGSINIYNNLFYQSDSTNVEHVIQLVSTITSGQEINFYNNTIYADTTGSPDTLIDNDYTGGIVISKNNLLYQAGTGSAWNLQTGDNHQYNCVYYPSGSAGHILNSTDINQNPLITTPSGDFSFGEGNIASNSPCKDTGANLSTTFSSAFNNVTRPQGSAWDIGAYEYVGAAPPPDTTPPASPTGLTVI